MNIEIGKNNEILRTISTPIDKNKYNSYVKLGKEMIKYIKNPDNWWVWLAAPQVGHNKRLIVASLPKDWDDESYPTIIMMNPEIIEHSEKKVLCEEWCLSLPQETGKVLRYTSIKMKYHDEKFNKKTLLLQWLQANIIQHEIDHLDWILFTDKIEKNTLFM